MAMPGALDGIAEIGRMLQRAEPHSFESLLRTVCGQDAVAEDNSPQANVAMIARRSAEDPAAFLRRKKIQQKLLFSYLQRVAPDTVAMRGYPTKEELSRIILAFWSGRPTHARGGHSADGPAETAGGAAVEADVNPGGMVRVEDVIPGQVWAQLLTLSSRDWTTDECAAGVRLQVAVRGHHRPVDASGVTVVSRWLRALSSTIIMNRTSDECADIGHGHGYRVGFRGNVHRDDAIAGMFNMNVLLAPEPAADGELRIQLVEVQLAVTAPDAHADVLPLMDAPEAVLALEPPAYGP
eukprot:m.56451 g.56451  ORF g.56451 m.56451 type:complete len:295 (-) comp7678_c0_seq1:87-971(-)